MIRSVLFACNLNSVRSPMAAALMRAKAQGRLSIDSAGVYEGGLDPFAARVLGEVGIALAGHEPKPMHALDLSKFDLVIALTPEAAAEARKSLPRDRVEFWDVANPSECARTQEEILAAYRNVREDLRRRLAERFADLHQSP
jgi:protein-tyrosine-phosphatase